MKSQNNVAVGRHVDRVLLQGIDHVEWTSSGFYIVERVIVVPTTVATVGGDDIEVMAMLRKALERVLYEGSLRVQL
jgi:hypothetical protein